MFIQKIDKFEENCIRQTKDFLQGNLEKYQKPLNEFDNLFEHLYLFSCCFWGCHKQNHIIEYLGGKVITNTSVAWQSMFRGYYDEALSHVRMVGEIANLLNLFWIKPEKLEKWLNSSKSIRIKEFGPAKVRKALSNNDWLVPFDTDHYGLLCETAVHPAPDGKPNSYANEHQPVLGCLFQEKGFDFCFWNILWAISASSGPIAKIANVDQSKAEELVALTIPVFEAACNSLPLSSGS